MIAGQMSRSAQTERSGRQWSRKGPDETHAVHRKELVAGSRRQVRGDRDRGGAGGAGQQHLESGCPFLHFPHETGQGENLADADRMHPDQRSGRSRLRGDAELLPVAGGVFLSAAKAPRDMAIRERMGNMGHEKPQSEKEPRAVRPAGADGRRGGGRTIGVVVFARSLHCAASLLVMARFPAAAHRTEGAALPHPARGRLCLCPWMGGRPHGDADESAGWRTVRRGRRRGAAKARNR